MPVVNINLNVEFECIALGISFLTVALNLCNYMNYGDCWLETSNYCSPGFVISMCLYYILAD